MFPIAATILLTSFLNLSLSAEELRIEGASPEVDASASVCSEADRQDIELQFQRHTSQVAHAAANQYQNIYECLMNAASAQGGCQNTVRDLVSLVGSYRAAQEILHRAAAHAEIEYWDEGSQGAASRCFLNDNGEINFDKIFQYVIPNNLIFKIFR